MLTPWDCRTLLQEISHVRGDFKKSAPLSTGGRDFQLGESLPSLRSMAVTSASVVMRASFHLAPRRRVPFRSSSMER